MRVGEEGFRVLETQALASLQNVQNSIISVGGGMILHRSNIDTLRTMGKIIYLFLDKNTLKKRVLSKILPSYIDPLDPENSFDQMYEKREILYKRAKTFQVDILNKTDEQILEELIAYIQNF
ncbi:MAG: hypothetical protein HYZ48_01295 [Chlamydiales bacterium]|nr:hypothetical protein [Chlamydiales bacterium]